MRYKRYKRKSGNTGMIKMRFQSFMDIHTDATTMQVITISAGGKQLLERCPAQFAAYKYFKLGRISVKLVPASTLPVDPTGLSIEAGEPGVDPRDQLTPGLMRITNGEDVFENLTGLSDAEQHAIYNNMLLDPRWFKWMLQSGVKRHATPRYWQIGQLHQDKWPGAVTNLPEITSGELAGTLHTFESSLTGVGVSAAYAGGSSPLGFFQTGHTGRLGWLPTDSYQYIKVGSDIISEPLIASPPEVECMKIILPKAYKTEYWYRAFITETVYFKSPILQIPGYRSLDVFHYQSLGVPRVPSQSYTPSIGDSDTGGNYGDS